MISLLFIVMILLRVRCNVCCDVEVCNLFNDKSRCGEHGNCKWSGDGDSNACSNIACASRNADECATRHEGGSTCILTDAGCKVAECSDFLSVFNCRDASGVGGQRTGCYWDDSSSRCKTATGCGSWNHNDCSLKEWNGNRCDWSEDRNTCVMYSSCGEIDAQKCNRSRVSGNNGIKCISTDGSSCRVAACGDWNNDLSECGRSTNEGSGSSDFYLSCFIESSNQVCYQNELYLCSSAVNDERQCDGIANRYRNCYWMSSCPSYDDPADSAGVLIYVPALLVALLLFLAL